MPRSILIINPFGIGDVLFSTPLIRNLRFYYSHAFIAVAVQKKVAPVLENNPNINKIIQFSRGDFKELSRQSRIKAIGLLFKALGEILQYKFDLCIDLSLEHRYSLFLKFLGVRRRIGFNYKHRGRFLTQRINLNGYEDKHVAEYHLELLKLLGLEPRFQKLELFLTQQEKDWAGGYLEKNGVSKTDLIIGIIPGGGASWGKQGYLKQWSADKYAELGDRLKEKLKAKIIIFAGPSDRSIAQKVIQGMSHAAVNMIGKTDLRQFMALINRCRFIVTNDAGPLHIAAALGIKSISMFGPVNEQVYGPYPPSTDHMVIKKELSCRPCYKKFRVPVCSYNQRCLTTITVSDVCLAAEGLILGERH